MKNLDCLESIREVRQLSPKFKVPFWFETEDF